VSHFCPVSTPTAARRRFPLVSALPPSPASRFGGVCQQPRSVLSLPLEQVPEHPRGAAELVSPSFRQLARRQAPASLPPSSTDASPWLAISVRFPAPLPLKMSPPPSSHPPHGLRTTPQCWHGKNNRIANGLSVSDAMVEPALAPGRWCLKPSGRELFKQLGHGLFWAQLEAGHARGLV
jgi:hypothetical protein